MNKERLDKLLVQRGLVETRARAQSLILAGRVLVNNQRVDKAGHLIAAEAILRIKEGLPYVSRGGIKLAAALDHFMVDPSGRDCLDVGASTGGFTDCLLQRGAASVVALDVGHGQLDWKLRQHPLVEVREHVNARYLSPDDFAKPIDLIVGDVSFISLTKIVPAIVPLMAEGGTLILLVKPQFEAGRSEVGKGGIVRNPVVQKRVVEEVTRCANNEGLSARGAIESPILGSDGNREFLACFASLGPRASRPHDFKRV
jgi:23S rRNA (cytidine1920-2'-O)/16S rRNA (cytidine1409-2'-O)-methyltransferase